MYRVLIDECGLTDGFVGFCPQAQHGRKVSTPQKAASPADQGAAAKSTARPASPKRPAHQVSKEQPKYRRQVQLEKNAAGGLGLRISGGIIDGMQHPVLVRTCGFGAVARGQFCQRPCLFPIRVAMRSTYAFPVLIWGYHLGREQIQGVEPGKPAAESGQIYGGGERAGPSPFTVQISCSFCHVAQPRCRS